MELKGKMENNSRAKTYALILLRLVKLIDLIAVCIPFIAAWTFYYSGKMRISYYRRGNYLVMTLYVIMYYLLAHLYGGFRIKTKRISELMNAQILAAILADFLIFIIMWLLIFHFPNVLIMLLVLAVQIEIIWIWSVSSHKWYYHHFPSRKAVIIYDEFKDLDVLLEQYGMAQHVDVIRKIDANDIVKTFKDTDNKSTENKIIAETVKGAEIVFLCSLHSHARNQIVKYCVSQGIVTYTIPRIGDIIMSGAEKLTLFHLPMLRLDRYSPTPEFLLVKRIFDIVLSSVAFIILSPLMLIVALIIKSDGGTALYKQERLTKDGKIFKILKFRSMRMDAEKDGVARLSTGDKDPRVTKIGHFIREFRIDELPQLFNIIKGDMSIVGPRPERPEIAAQYKKTLPEFDLRLQCRAGLTGYAQVYGMYDSSPYCKLLMDLMYISRPSLAEDGKIIFATLQTLVTKESTTGVAEGQVTAERESQ